MPDQLKPQYPADWGRLTREQKRAWRFDRWRESARQTAFVSPEVQEACMTRVDRLMKVFDVEEPDRVPVSAPAGMLPFKDAGLDYRTSVYEPEKAIEAINAFNAEHADEIENLASWPLTGITARALDILDIKTYAYPGHGMPMEGQGFQFVEGEYMRADEYDAFIRDPSDFWLRTYLPRAYGAFEPFASLEPLTDIVEIYSMQLAFLARPDIQASLQRLLDAGKELGRYFAAMSLERSRTEVYGFAPNYISHFAKAPFDTIGDTLRGTREIIMDMFRQPDKLLQALDVAAELTIDCILRSPAAPGYLGIFFPLHKGADGWMSEDQFQRFYWPTLKKVIQAYIDEGLLVILFAEGAFNTRLELVNEFPKGAVTWLFDRTDMAKAKQILGSTCCLQGNIPSSLLVAGSPEEVKDQARRLIETCAPGGGYVLTGGAMPEYPRLENLKAMVAAAREYGGYPL